MPALERGVGGNVERDETLSAFPSRLLAVGAAAVLLADVPGLFTRGDVLRLTAFPFLAAAAALLGVLLPGRRGPAWGTAALLALPALVPLLALLAAVNPSVWGALRGGTNLLALAALSLGLLRTWRGGRDAGDALQALVLAGGLAAAWTLLDLALRGWPSVGPFGRPGIAGPVLAALLAAAVVLPRRLPRPLHVVLVAVLALACLATDSRTGWAAALLGVLAAGLFAAAPGRRKPWAVSLTAAALALGLAVALSHAGHLRVPGGQTTLEVRFGLWRATSTLVGERPVSGHGLGSFPSEILRVRDSEEAALSRGRRPRVAHNDVLHAAAEGGVPAGLVLVAWMAGLMVVGWLAVRRADGEPTRRRLAAALGAFVAIAVAAQGEDVLLDPAPALVAAVAAATLAASRRDPRGMPRLLPVVLVVFGLLSLLGAGVYAKDLLADTHVRRYRETIQGGVDPLTEAVAAQQHLVDGALVHREDHPEAWYRLGVHRAELETYGSAREAWRSALEADPGMTEAWLDMERSYELEGRAEDARAALLEARRRDPTRYDVHMRLGHLALGPEPVPGEWSRSTFDPVRAHAHYNAAERCGPDRFETWVARARVARRRSDLEEAGAMLRQADALSPKAPEILHESFRLAEVQRTAPDLGTAAILALALGADPALAASVQREIESLLAEGLRREEGARKAVEGSLRPTDYTAANRAYDAAARRIAGLLLAGVIPHGTIVVQADADEAAGAWRSALARLRALLAWADRDPPPQEIGRVRHDWLRYVAALYRRAAQVATRTDAALSRTLFARAHAAQGALLLEDREWVAARDTLRRAAEDAPEDRALLLDLARALVKTGEEDEAAEALQKVLRAAPELSALVKRDAILKPLLDRPAVAALLR